MKKLILGLLIFTNALLAMEFGELEYRVELINQEIAAKEQLLDDFIWETEAATDVLDRNNLEFEPAIEFIEECAIKKSAKFEAFKRAKNAEIAELISANISHIKHQEGLL